ncbi:uncharacterized protein LOC113339633 [Papaver somniferum]|uniref:uncharacterized protein LOC113339633 n=1 Tax=Papaver somniferum TaxID=3469 RepID=UPI000E7014ED|nr:uncharacterized protein LOC113339633 [Papaver somniferum]
MVERKGCVRRDRGMRDFNRFIDQQELMDLPIAGAKYSWSSSANSPNPRLSKIDRFLISPEWEDHFPSINVSALARPLSDHKPIMLSCSYEDWGAPLFRCEATWFLEPTLFPLMKTWWTSFNCTGSASFVMAKKLQFLKEQLKLWNKNVFGRIDKRNEKILAEISLLDQSDDNRTISVSQTTKRNSLRMEYEKTADMLHLHWLNKSRAQWLALAVINDHIVTHCKEQFSSNFASSISLAGMNFKQLSVVDASWLERPIEADEVLLALHNLGQDKAAGPDGFQVIVFIKGLDFMKSDIMKVIKEFERNGYIDWRLNPLSSL